MVLTYYGKGVGMQIYIYCTEVIGAEHLDFLDMHKIICFDKIDNIIDQISEEWLPVLLVWSQPSTETINVLNRFKWYKKLIRTGIRFINNESLYFDNTNKYEILTRLNVQYNIDLKKSYLITIKDLILESEDHQYLASFYEDVDFKDFKRSREKRHKGSFCGMLTIVGHHKISKKQVQMIANNVNGKTLLIDGNLLLPSLDEVFGISQLETSIKSHLTGIDNTGFNVALDTILKGVDIKSSVDDMVKKVSVNLDVMLGNYNLYNYEHYDINTVKRLLIILQQLYECIVVVASDFPYDEITMLTLHMSCSNIFITSGSLSETRYLYQLINLLEAKQGILRSKNKILLKKTGKLKDIKSNTILKFLFKEHYYNSDEAIFRKGIGRIK